MIPHFVENQWLLPGAVNDRSFVPRPTRLDVLASVPLWPLYRPRGCVVRPFLCHQISRGIRFVIRLKDGETMASLCREFGISRKTGYKIFERYQECGLEGLTDLARAPTRFLALGRYDRCFDLFGQLIGIPMRASRTIRERLLRRLPHEIKVPASSTIHAILDRHGLVTRMKRSRTRTEGTSLSSGLSPNELWCTDYKGEFKLGNHRYCYPLTVTDHASRFLLLCEALESNQEQFAFTAFERLFQERGLPQAIRSDNGVPFASPNGLFNLSRLSVWWLRLGSPSSASSQEIRNRTAGTSACI